MFLAPVVAHFFSEVKLIALTRIISLTFLFSASKIIHIALLRRKLDFRRIAIIDTSAFFIAGIAGITAALCGLGVWSLVIQNLISGLVSAGLATFPVTMDANAYLQLARRQEIISI